MEKKLILILLEKVKLLENMRLLFKWKRNNNLNHEAFDRALYSDGALTAAKWLTNKRAGLYSMRDLLNFK